MRVENVHHIFKVPEVRKKIIEIFGEPETEKDRLFIESETKWAWEHLPKYRMNKDKHKHIHIEQTKQYHFMKYKLKNFDEKLIKNKNLREKNLRLSKINEELRLENSYLKLTLKENKNIERKLLFNQIKTASKNCVKVEELIPFIKVQLKITENTE